MKTILTFISCLVALASSAANPSFQSFSTNDFRTNGYVISIAPTAQVVTQLVSTVGATLDGVQIFSSGSGLYFLDCRKTNGFGQTLIYQSILATNTCDLTITNCRQWSLLSLNIVASGTNALIIFPTNLPHLDTNGLTLTSGRYRLTLTNGNELRFTLQSNITLSTLWATFGQ